MQRAKAETVATQALAWLAQDPDLFATFLGATGIGVDTIANRAHKPDFMISVLDFLMMDDAWVTGFCDGVGLNYDAPMRARQALPGGAQVHWT